MTEMNLSRTLIVEAAMDILDSFGLGDMTMRRVADQLGVAPGALYWHIANKQDLLSAIAEQLLSPLTTDGTQEDPAAFCRELRRALLSHRDGAEVIASALAQPGSKLRTSLESSLSSALTRLPASDAAAATGASAIVHLLLGACVQEQSRRQFEVVSGLMDEASISGAHHAIDAQVSLLLSGITKTTH